MNGIIKAPSALNALTSPEMKEIQTIGAEAALDAGFEKMLKFKKGVYECDGAVVEMGTEYVAHCIGWTRTWIKFIDQKVVDRKRFRVGDGRRAPERDELGDMDNSKWPAGLNGPHSDPWAFQFELPLEEKAGNLVVFVTGSFGGKRAVADLCKAYSRHVERIGASQQPVIRIAGTTFQSDKYGAVHRPLFEIIGWAGGKEAIREFGGTDGDGEGAQVRAPADELNDEIPF